MAMSLEQFDSATALSKETSDENLYEVEADAVEAQVASVREDGLTHFICLTFDIIVWMFFLHAPTHQEERAGGPATSVAHTRGPGRRAGLCHFTLLGMATLC